MSSSLLHVGREKPESHLHKIKFFPAMSGLVVSPWLESWEGLFPTMVPAASLPLDVAHTPPSIRIKLSVPRPTWRLNPNLPTAQSPPSPALVWAPSKLPDRCSCQPTAPPPPIGRQLVILSKDHCEQALHSWSLRRRQQPCTRAEAD